MEENKKSVANLFLPFYLISCIVLVVLAIVVLVTLLVKAPVYTVFAIIFFVLSIAYCVTVLILETKRMKAKAAE